MPELDPTVRKFTSRFIVKSDDEKTPLEDVWNEYRPRYPHGVPRERFRWHLEQAGVDTQYTADGVVVHGRLPDKGDN